MQRVQIGLLAAVAIVALRLGVGLHFFWEGADKLNHPKPFSAGFLGNAKGPLAPVFKTMVWDADGWYRLDTDAMLAHWTSYGDQVVGHYQFDDKQTDAVTKKLKEFEGRYKSFRGSRREEIEEYYAQLERRDANATNPARAQLASLRVHDARIDGERNKLKADIFPEIDRMSKDLENDLNSIATVEQWKRHGRLPIGYVGQRFGDSVTVDRWIPWFDISVGLLLIVGLFVRPAAILGGLFLLSVCLSQWPGSVGAAPIYPQFIEMLAMFTLAAIGAGRFAGLDFVISGLRRMCCPPKQGAIA
jgi:uncharacterized membrane protein YphA (DoxX/SURF4 family)